jgi:hypothetical protein
MRVTRGFGIHAEASTRWGERATSVLSGGNL